MQTKIYYCEFCKFQSGTLPELREHQLQTYHVFYCNELAALGGRVPQGTCLEYFVSENQLRTHQKKTGCIDQSALRDENNFNDIQPAQRNQQQSRQQKQPPLPTKSGYDCMACGQEFKSLEALLTHQGKTNHAQVCQCEFCGAQFATDAQLEKHYKKANHSGIDNEMTQVQMTQEIKVKPSVQKAKTAAQEFKVVIEQMEEEDLPLVRKLNNQFIEAVGEVSLQKFKYLLNAAAHAYLVKDQGRVIAFYMTHPAGIDYQSKNYIWHNSQGHTDFIYMDRIIVDTEYQNLKIGTKLYEHLEKVMRKQKLSLLCAEVNVVPPNPASLRFHKKLGFKIVKHAHEHEPGYVVDFLVKQIAGVKPNPNTKKPVKPIEVQEEVKEQQQSQDCEICRKKFKSIQEFQQHQKSEAHLKMKEIKSKLYTKYEDEIETEKESKPKRNQKKQKVEFAEGPNEEVLPMREKKVYRPKPQQPTTEVTVKQD